MKNVSFETRWTIHININRNFFIIYFIIITLLFFFSCVPFMSRDIKLMIDDFQILVI